MGHVFSRLLITLLTALALATSLGANAQDLTLKQVVEANERSEILTDSLQPVTNKITPDGDTPLSSMLALIKAYSEDDLEEGAKYLDLRYLPSNMAHMSGEELLRKLVILWQQQHVLDLSTLSDEPTGHSNDGLPSYRDLIGAFKFKDEPSPVYFQLVPNDDGRKIWKISNATVAQIPELWDKFGYHPWAESLSLYLPDFTVFNMENWQVVSFIIILISAWYLTALLRWMMLTIVAYSETYKDTMQRLIRVPLRMFLFFMLVQWAVGHLGLSLSARIWLETGTLNYLALTYLTLGIIELLFALYISKASVKKHTVAVLKPLITSLKILVVIIIALNWFQNAGFNITTILTGLGIGSLAIALAAQKTLENVFGAFTLFIARPIQPGDFCKFGDITGTVEEIGLRSTRIRKLNRSVVHVPNSVFASNNLENYAEIDRRLYNRELRLRLDTTPDQIRLLLIELRKLIISHPKTLDVAARVRFEDIERDAFRIVINAYISTTSIVEFKAISEDINLRVLEIIRAQGVTLAIPEQHLFLSRNPPISEEYAIAAEQSIDALSNADQLPFPDFSTGEKEELKDTLPYPPKGTPTTNE